jgi:hypothetical protein
MLRSSVQLTTTRATAIGGLEYLSVLGIRRVEDEFSVRSFPFPFVFFADDRLRGPFNPVMRQAIGGRPDLQSEFGEVTV